MAWSALGTQFCLEIGFGVLVALAFVPKAPVGTFFYRIMGTAAMVPLAVATLVPVLVGEGSVASGVFVGGAVSLAAYPVYSGPVRGMRWAVGLGVGILGSAVALAFALTESGTVSGPAGVLLGSLSALATGTVAGSVALAMVLGHWYLTVPNLSVTHLQRLNRVTIVSMVASLVLVGLTCLAFDERLGAGDRSLFDPWGLFHLGTRVAVGLVLPLVFAGMTASSLKFENTRSATGILYASTVLVLIGTAVSISLQDSYGVPL